VFAKLPYERPSNVEAMCAWIRAALGRGDVRLPFAVIADGQVAGTTSYWYPDPVRRQIEIGSTWLGRPWWGTGVNPRATCARSTTKTPDGALVPAGCPAAASRRPRNAESPGRVRIVKYLTRAFVVSG
jgi:hypothetical protein